MAFLPVKTRTTLFDLLTGHGYTRTKIRQLLKHGAIEVNGKAAKDLDHILLKGDSISVSKHGKIQKAALESGINIVHEDDSLIIAEKPVGLLTVASEREKKMTLYYQLNDLLRQRDPEARERIFIVHRLDRETSGLIIFAKNESVKRQLQDRWKEVEKRYYAVVEGTPPKKEGEISSLLIETSALRVYSTTRGEDARPAVTKYRVIRHGREYALLDILLETGRKNQIRVHLSDIGHPVAGDKKYGAKTNPIRRLCLHAYLISFRHPVTGKQLRFESKMPGGFSAMVKGGST